MNFSILAAQRYSVRKFETKRVEQAKLQAVLEAARLAPTAANAQPQRILVLQSQESLAKLKRCTKYHFDAPLVFLICYDRTVCCQHPFSDGNFGTIDSSIVATHMLLKIAELGLGATWVGFFNPKIVAQEFALPENYVPVALLPTGYPCAQAMPSLSHCKRLPLSRTVFYDSFSEDYDLT